jgi:hypothetical protein
MIASVFAFSLAAVSSASPPPSVESDFPWSEYYLTDDKVAAYRAAALRGEVEPAVALSDYYDLWKDDRETGEFWGRLAAEYGGCQELRRFHYRYLRQLTPPNTPERQRAWVERRDQACADEQNADAQR